MNFNMKKFVGFAATAALAAATILPTATFAVSPDPSTDPFGLDVVGGSVGLGGGDVRETAGRIINVALGFLGIIAVVIVLIGGFKYMVSGGNEEKTSEAKNMIVAGIIGLAIILSAWAITTFVIGSLLTATQPAVTP
jgi:hypothetical protein